MFKRRLSQIIFAIAVACSVFGGSFVARVAVQQAIAAPTTNPLKELQSAGGKAYTGSAQKTPRDLRYTVATVIKMALQLVGIIMLCLMLYSGYLWMSARGDDSKVSEAKTVIRNAVIGMALVAMSYTLVSFVFRSVFIPNPEQTNSENAAENQTVGGFLNNQLNPFAK